MATCVLSSNEYNALPSFNEASATLKSFQENQDLMLFGDIFLKHLMHGAWGLCLVHRHFDLEHNEVMVEQPALRDGMAVTKAVDVNQITTPLMGTSYRFDGDTKLQAFEYCYGSDSFLHEALRDERFLAFVRELHKTMAEAGVSNVFGLAPVASLRPGLETTIYEAKENVVELMSGDAIPEGDEFVSAAWIFNEEKPGVQQGCARVSVCVDSNSGHSRSFTHNFY